MYVWAIVMVGSGSLIYIYIRICINDATRQLQTPDMILLGLQHST